MTTQVLLPTFMSTLQISNCKCDSCLTMFEPALKSKFRDGARLNFDYVPLKQELGCNARSCMVFLHEEGVFCLFFPLAFLFEEVSTLTVSKIHKKHD